MKNRFYGMYVKLFSYTILILIVVIGTAAVFFSNQITAILESMERQQLQNIFAPLFSQLQEKTDDEIVLFAEEFHQKNASVEFSIYSTNGELIFKTANAHAINPDNTQTQSKDNVFWGNPSNNNFQTIEPLSNGMTIYMGSVSSGGTVYSEFIKKTTFVLFALFVIGSLSAGLFAYRITKPIKNIAQDTKRMSNLEFVPPPVARKDEIGQLANDVYKMYEALKAEIEREREMEENQRYFFSAASHELKTPIASTLILLQGMFDNIGDYKDHSKYLRECIKMMKNQSKMISEILEIVRLTDGRISPNKEKVELYTLVQSVVAAHQTLAESKELCPIVSLSDTLICQADRKMLNRVISNVVLNAIQNTPEKGKIQIEYEEQGEDTIRLLIVNEGVNISEKALSKIFEPFHRENEARSSSQERSGLGLVIVKKTLDCMGIPFSLENTERGICFWMDIPKHNG